MALLLLGACGGEGEEVADVRSLAEEIGCLDSFTEADVGVQGVKGAGECTVLTDVNAPTEQAQLFVFADEQARDDFVEPLVTERGAAFAVGPNWAVETESADAMAQVLDGVEGSTRTGGD